jgi:Cu+-exporting ATPase
LRGYPHRVWVERGGAQAEIPLSELRPGEAVILHPGDTVPGDGVVLDGEGGVCESWLTGTLGLAPIRSPVRPPLSPYP